MSAEWTMVLKLEQTATPRKVLREFTTHTITVLHREGTGSVQLLVPNPLPGLIPEPELIRTGTGTGSGPGSGSHLWFWFRFRVKLPSNKPHF